MDTMQEVNSTSKDEYGMKVGGVLNILDKFSTRFGLRLSHLLFAAAEETSKTLQAKSTTVQEVLSSVCILKSFFEHQRNDEAFNSFFPATKELGEKLEVRQPH